MTLCIDWRLIADIAFVFGVLLMFVLSLIGGHTVLGWLGLCALKELDE